MTPDKMDSAQGECSQDATKSANPSEIDLRLAESDINKLAAISGSTSETDPPTGGPFYNCFMNSFVNSPNFRKGLSHNRNKAPHC